jgi:hypothetical protein
MEREMILPFFTPQGSVENPDWFNGWKERVKEVNEGWDNGQVSDRVSEGKKWVNKTAKEKGSKWRECGSEQMSEWSERMNAWVTKSSE